MTRQAPLLSIDCIAGLQRKQGPRGLQKRGRLLSLRHWRHAVWLFTVFAASASAENLLANPGFEDLAGDKPAHWDQFVQPMPGAVAKLTDTAHGGAYGVQLHIPTPYEKDPLNNWSQNIMGDFAGETLRISGFIRVESATEAALLVQLWRKKPWGVLGAASTSTDMPVYGTQDWQEVSMEVVVPDGVDFVTLRCILKGSGSAYFDDLSVTRVEETVDGQGREATEAKPNTADISAVTPEVKRVTKPEVLPAEAKASPEIGVPEVTAPEVATPERSSPEVAPAHATVLPMMNQLEAEVKRLRDANELLTDTLQQIQGANEELLQEMLAIQEELRELKAGKHGAAAPALIPDKSRVPPLVPRSQSREFNAP